MTPFPAWFDFHRDPVIRKSVCAQTLYAELLIRPRSFSDPVEVKTLAFGAALAMHPDNVSRALSLLISRGYLDEHPREHRNAPRRVTVALVRRDSPSIVGTEIPQPGRDAA